MHVNGFSNPHRPCCELIKFSLVQDCSFYGGNEFGEWADVDADGMPAEHQRFYKCRAAPNMIVQHQVGRLRECLDGGARE